MSLEPVSTVFVCRFSDTDQYSVFLVVLSVLLENSGLLKAGASAQSEFEPAEGSKVVKFSDVHGVDEAKEVRLSNHSASLQAYHCGRNLVTSWSFSKTLPYSPRSAESYPKVSC